MVSCFGEAEQDTFWLCAEIDNRAENFLPREGRGAIELKIFLLVCTGECKSVETFLSE